MIYRQSAIDALDCINGTEKVLRSLPSAQQTQNDEVTFWQERAREYENMIAGIVAEQAKGIKFDLIQITGEGIIFKKSQPERKTARWIDKGWDGDANFRIDGRGDCWRVHECSNCHEQIDGAMTKYCPNCGARMEGISE